MMVSKPGVEWGGLGIQAKGKHEQSSRGTPYTGCGKQQVFVTAGV